MEEMRNEMDNRYLSFEEQNELIEKSIAGDEKATIELINLCYPIACKIAKHYILSIDDMNDLMQEAVFGILLAIPRYRPDKGTKFTTYCTFWIQKKMQQYIASNFIKYPEYRIKDYKNYLYFVNEFVQKNGREPNNEEIIEGLNITDDKLLTFQMTLLPYLSLEEIEDFIPADEKDIGDIAVLHTLLEDALDFVSDKEKYVIIRRFGLYSMPIYTRVEIAKELNCSTEWIRHLEVTGLNKMKQYLLRIGFIK